MIILDVRIWIFSKTQSWLY